MMPRLVEVLERSRSLGFLGPGSVRVHVEHALGFAAGVDRRPARFLDLGSGGGVPGLVLACHWTAAAATLLDARERRCEFLEEAVRQLGLAPRVDVWCARAEEAARHSELRGAFDLVVARGFGRPAVTAECGAPFVRVGGMLVVSEPPRGGEGSVGDPSTRWPVGEAGRLGLAPAGSWGIPYRYQALRQVEPCPARFPRRAGIPTKRPLF